MELSRLFFAGFAKPQERLNAIRDYLHQMEEAKAVLCAIRDSFHTIEEQVLPQRPDWQQVLRFQGYTIAYGIAAAEFEIGWYRRLLDELEEEV